MHRREPSAEQPDTQGTLYSDDLWGSDASFGDPGALDTAPEIPPLAHPSADPKRWRAVHGLRKRSRNTWKGAGLKMPCRRSSKTTSFATERRPADSCPNPAHTPRVPDGEHRSPTGGSPTGEPAAQTPVGWREWLALPGLRIPAIKAKMDTGARTSALHTFRLERYDEDGRTQVRFWIHPCKGAAISSCPASRRSSISAP